MSSTPLLRQLSIALCAALIGGCTLAGDVRPYAPMAPIQPIVVQAAVPVLPDDTPETLAARVLAQEHRIYPQAVRWFVEDRLRLTADGRVVLQGVSASVQEAALVWPPLES